MDMHKHTTHCTHSRIHTMCPNGHWSSFARHFSLNHPFSKWIYVYCIECMPISEQANENKTSVFHCNWILNYVNENGVFDWISTFGFTKWTRSKCGHSHSQMNGFSSSFSFSYPSLSFLALFSVLSNFGFRIADFKFPISDFAYIFKFHGIKQSKYSKYSVKIAKIMVHWCEYTLNILVYSWLTVIFHQASYSY